MMYYHSLSPKQAVQQANFSMLSEQHAFVKCKAALQVLLNSINAEYTAAQATSMVQKFLEATFPDNYSLNTQSRTCLLIHGDNKRKKKAGVLIEVMDFNNLEDRYKQLLLRYLQERVQEQNHELQHLISTDAREWFVFDAQAFDKLLHVNTQLLKDCQHWVKNKNPGSDLTSFYLEVAPTAVVAIPAGIACTYFNMNDYQKLVLADSQESDAELVALFTLLSPQFLLKEHITDEPKEMSSPVCYANLKSLREGFEE